MNLLSAKEASHLTGLAQTRHGKEFLYLLDKIKDASMNGENFYYYSGQIDEEIKNLLRKLGYTVNPHYRDKDVIVW